jgi:plastocyanin
MFRGRRFAFAPIMAMAMTALSLGSGASIAQAIPVTTYTIGVDNVSPSGHLFMYTDFFPRTGTNVLQGSIIDFKWSTGSPDGFHTATLLKTGDTPNGVYASTPQVTPDADDGATTAQENPAIGAPSNPGCGTVGSPCAFDGSAQLNSGAFPTAPGKDFYVTINATAGTTVNFLCLIHPGMVGSLSVVESGASTPTSVTTAAGTQYTSDTAEAVGAEAAVSVPGATTNSDGTKTWNALAGTEGPHEQVLEFFPKNLNITTGDSVKWTSMSHDIHTVTFPDGPASAADDFHQFMCEAGPPDTAAAAPPAPPCANPANFESHWTPGPAGGTTLTSPATVATSGVIAAAPLPFPSNYTFKVAGAGSYTYQCKVHDHMTATLSAVAAAAVTVTLPKAGGGQAASGDTAPAGSTGVAFLGLGLFLTILVGARALARRPRS